MKARSETSVEISNLGRIFGGRSGLFPTSDSRVGNKHPSALELPDTRTNPLGVQTPATVYLQNR
jgi:hypothetical protein